MTTLNNNTKNIVVTLRPDLVFRRALIDSLVGHTSACASALSTDAVRLSRRIHI